MRPSEAVARHFASADWRQAEAARRSALDRLLAGVADASPAVRARLAREAAGRVLEREPRPPAPTRRPQLRRALQTGDAGDARARIASIDAYLEIAPGWAEGCEMEAHRFERAALCVVAGLADGDAAAVASAAVEHAAWAAWLAAYAAASRAESVAHDLAWHREVAHLALRLLALAAA
jgi:hypothetical protein